MENLLAYDSDMHLSLVDIALDDKNNPTVIQVTIKQSKTDPFRQGADLYLGKTGKDICNHTIPCNNQAPCLCLLTACT